MLFSINAFMLLTFYNKCAYLAYGQYPTLRDGRQKVDNNSPTSDCKGLNRQGGFFPTTTMVEVVFARDSGKLLHPGLKSTPSAWSGISPHPSPADIYLRGFSFN